MFVIPHLVGNPGGGNTQLSMGQLVPEHPVQEYLRQVEQAVRRATELVRQLLLFSRKEVAHPVEIDLGELVKNLLGILKRVIGEHIEFDLKFSPDLKLIRTDPGQIEQVIINLCTNARDAMPKGGRITIGGRNLYICSDPHVEVPHWAPPGSHVELVVSDDGTGIPKEHLDRIFDPFFTTKEVGKGTGLGLASVYGIVQHNEGVIHVENKPEGGTRFRILFPAVEPKKEKGTGSDSSENETGERVEKKGIILIAEDDKSVRDIMKRFLVSSGYEVLETENGEEAVDLFEDRHEKIDLVVLDIVMPKLNGTEVYRLIKEKKPDTRILFVTGYSAGLLEEAGISETEVRILHKPIRPEEFLEEVRRILSSQPVEKGSCSRLLDSRSGRE